MKHLSGLLLIGMITVISAQTIPPLPVPVATGTAEVWNDSLYYFGGTGDWNGTIRYPRIYKFDGASWSYQDSIPDNALWDVKSVLVGDEVFLLSGWPNGNPLIRSYNFSNRNWTYLAASPNTRAWGTTAEAVNGFIYQFNPVGFVYEYDIANDSWSTKIHNTTVGSFGLSSVVYQDEIYVVGYENGEFFKYTPGSDSLTRLADTPYKVVASALVVMGNILYCVGGGNDEEPLEPYDSVLVYDVLADSWQLDLFQLSAKRQWMTDTQYQGSLYILGGFDSSWSAVDVVEEIVPLGGVPLALGSIEPESIPMDFLLSQNYPNPFNPITNINYQIPGKSRVEITVYNLLGKKVRTLVKQQQVAGNYQVQWDGKDDKGDDLASGMYIYQINCTPLVSPLEGVASESGSANRGKFRGVSETRKMLLVR